jgi:hypothetical protein
MRFPILALFTAVAAAGDIDLFNLAAIDFVRCEGQVTDFKGRKALQVRGNAQTGGNSGGVAILKEVDFQDGEFEVDLAGEPGPGAAAAARGFVGMAFRVANGATYESFYLRPTNGRAEDQVRRNHSVQYESLPDFPWSRMRKEFPEKYETYTDLQPATWTRYRVTAQGESLKLYVNGAQQPTLIVTDARSTRNGKLALWIGPGTVAHFSGLKVK